MKNVGMEWQVIDTPIQLKEVSSISTPFANKLKLYAKDNAGTSALYYKNDAGTEVGPLGAGTVTGTGTATRVAFWSASSVLSSSANLYWDNTNSYLSLFRGTSPEGRLHIAVDTGIFAIMIDGLVSSASPTIGGRGYRTSLAAPSAVTTNDQLIHVSGGGYHSGAAFVTNKGSFIVKASEAWTATANGTYSTIEGTPATTTTRQEIARWTPNSVGGFQVIGGGTGLLSGTNGIEIVPKVGQASGAIVQGHAYGTGVFMNFQGSHARGVSGTPTASQADDALVRYAALSYGASQFTSARVADITFYAAENNTNSAAGTYIAFGTTPTGSVTIAERFRIGPAGQWGIGGATYGGSGDIFSSGGSGAAPTWVTRATLNAALDHGTLAGLADDDHTGYALLAGRSGGQTLKGGTAASDGLTLQSTSHATRGKIFFGANSAYDEAGAFLGLGTTSPSKVLHVVQSSTTSSPPMLLTETDTGASGIPIAIQAQYTDSSSTNRLSAQCLRFEYTKSAGATSVPTFFDAGIVVTATFNDSMASKFIGLDLEGPNMAAGKTLTTYVGIDLSVLAQGAGTVTNKYAFAFPTDNTDPTGGGGAATGRIPILIGGALKYIPYY